jgi:glycosyltransferase involved in cell wall biosynthesis
MKIKPEISVVVIGLNEEKLVGKCMQSLAHQDFHYPYEVVFVDGGSADKTVKIVRSYNKRLNLTVIIYKAIAIGDARQKGFELTKGTIVASTDSDVILPENWLSSMYSYFNDHPSCIGLVGPYITYPNSYFVQQLFLNLCRIGDFFVRILIGFYPFRGLNFAVKRTVWSLAGGFERTISALEDVDLSLKVSKFGHICYAPRLVILTSARRFKGKIILWNTWYRLMAFYHRVYLRDYTKYKDWEQIRE